MGDVGAAHIIFFAFHDHYPFINKWLAKRIFHLMNKGQMFNTWLNIRRKKMYNNRRFITIVFII